MEWLAAFACTVRQLRSFTVAADGCSLGALSWLGLPAVLTSRGRQGSGLGAVRSPVLGWLCLPTAFGGIVRQLWRAGGCLLVALGWLGLPAVVHLQRRARIRLLAVQAGCVCLRHLAAAFASCSGLVVCWSRWAGWRWLAASVCGVCQLRRARSCLLGEFPSRACLRRSPGAVVPR